MTMTYATFSRFLDPQTMQWVVTCHTDLGIDYYTDGAEHLVYRSNWVRETPGDETSSFTPRWTRYNSDGDPFRVPDHIADSLERLTDKWLAEEEDKEKQLLRDIAITAVEGGSDYWCVYMEGYEPDGEGNHITPIVYMYEANEDGSDVSDECSGWGVPKGTPCAGHQVTLETIRKGMELARVISPANFTGHNFDTAIAEKDAGDVDADGADIAVQFGLFGKVVYG